MNISQDNEVFLDDDTSIFKNIIDKMPKAIIVHKNDRMLYLNEKSLELIGLTLDEAIGEDIKEIVDKADRIKAMNRLDEIREGEKLEKAEIKIKGKSGKAITCETESTRMYLGENNVILTFLSDITKRKETEKELKNTKHHLENILKNAKVAYSSIDLKKEMILETSNHFKELYGYGMKDIYKDRTLWKKIIYKEDFKEFEKAKKSL